MSQTRMAAVVVTPRCRNQEDKDKVGRDKMLRYLLKTLLQMNLFTDTVQNPGNSTDVFFNTSLPSFNSSLLDWGNFTGFNASNSG
ncbi:roundabout homolog 3-like isoform X2 [Entelurus aequoreus]|uniref:roundabout homolog 3-like isoform X2 n=1 Tax=Entelurus aequoreus TaxID=161455 RepID=UPI002B1D47E8|nr:roundabout homolog 3-like isoform X2 [Entelurus aequoreus]XP_061904287.1 roundabout homolog 3-like isoform X2 [Entelurus aequoreus]